LFPFFLAKLPQKEPKTANISRLRARRGLRALDLRRLLKKAGENFCECVVRRGKATQKLS
jgi:hypothetical protein